MKLPQPVDFGFVGDNLKVSLDEPTLSPTQKESLARSAFNRYYYSTFWSIKVVWRLLDSKELIVHKGSGKKLVEKISELKIDSEGRQELLGYAQDLQRIQELAYKVREKVDYHFLPDFEATLKVGNIALGEAQQWPIRCQRTASRMGTVIQRYGGSIGSI